ncbi:Predicted pyrophosphatase or phosphodiesterase, AlkP superfamily [Halolactibacillus halophilus]|uniref:Alkaline phosphatase family protein n=1 Tax=Halolactibacillus halophilus TaxID=306540 RepID=A0A1I5SQ21_9BACI|nr:ectonucleotide pyrophosphatase/phosphodiesterase [Halolactibacillus halophilus]GEM02635.1 alkaline phosphatase family protein [Halolactibacillus halophilus]SFP72892.1 Predicted pyrophosphatase or phosphodiesterase, AlkP superfamily [Halolactibacillus halophilus]
MERLNGRLAEHVIVVSYDAFSEDHFNQAKKLPNLQKLVADGVHTTKLKSVNPTMTYVVHSTMVTGVYPNKHGVSHNNPLQPFVKANNQAWHWYRDDLNVPTIYDVLKANGLTSAGILWPVTAKSSITYNLPEVVAINGENQALKVLKNGSPLYCLGLELKYGQMRKGTSQPYLDDFSTACAVDTIKRKQPNLMLLHLIDLDDTKHAYGTQNQAVDAVIERMDKRLGDIIKATEEAGIMEETVFIVLGDHGQFDVRFKVYLNNLLKQHGLIEETNEWRAYFQSTGGAAYLHIKDGDKEAEAHALAIMNDIVADSKYGVKKLYKRAELDELHVEPSIHYMLEATKGYSFEDDLSDEDVVDLTARGEKYATHGYTTEQENYRCNFIISGKNIKANAQVGEIEMVDVAPTIACILGVKLNGVDGRSLDEVFKDN